MESTAATSVGTAVFRRPRKSFYTRHERLILGTISVSIFLTLWEAAAALAWVEPRYISAPSLILLAAGELIASGDLGKHMWVSGLEFVLGFGLSVLVGVPLGVILGWYRKVAHIFDPFVTGLYATPMAALIPLLIMWLGVGIWSKVAVIFLSSVFPIAVSIIAGMNVLDPKLIRAAQSFGASDTFIFRTVALPATVPFFLSGLRLGMARGLVGIVIGEMYAATAGLGFLISTSGTSFQTDRVFVGVTVVAVGGVILSALIRRLEQRFEVWRPKAR